MRRLRRPRARPRRRAAHLLRRCTRCSTAARSRPASPSPRTDGSRCCATSGSSRRYSTSRSSRGLQRRARDRPHALLDDRLVNAWANAQPLIQHGRARTVALGHNGNLVNAGELRDELREEARLALDVRHRGDRRVDRERRARRSRRRSPTRCARLEGALLVVGARRGTLVRVPRPARLPPARARTARRRSGGRVRDVRARPRRRRVRARGRAAASSCIVDDDGLHSVQARRAGRAAARSASSSSSTSPAPTRRLDGVEVHGARVRMGERLARRRRSRPTSCCRSPTRARPPRSASRARRHPVQRRADQEPLHRPHLHPARPGAARAGHPAEVQPARRGRGQARRRRRRLDRARQHDAADRADALRRGRRRGAHPHLVAAGDRPCFYGIDLADEDEMIAADATVEEMREAIGATSLAYLSHEGLRRRRSGRPRRSAARA